MSIRRTSSPHDPIRRATHTARLLLWGSLAAALLGLGCAERDAPQVPPGAAPPVLVTPVVVTDITDRISATGQILAKAQATVAAQVDGQVTHIAVEEGDAIEQDQVLLEVDPERRQLELANALAQQNEAEAQLAESERDQRRVGQLSQQNAASQARLDEAETREALMRSRLAGARSRVGLARRALSDASIRAPFDGLVARRHVSVGEYLSPGLPLFEVVALDPIEVEFALAEIDSARVEIGHPVEVQVTPYPDTRFAARVTVISPTIDPATRTLRVKAELPNPDGRLRPGLFARVDLGVDHRKDVVMVPEDSLVQRTDGSVVFRLAPGSRVERLRVETGVFRDGLVEVRSGLVPGDRIVVRGQNRLVDGLVVSLRDRTGEPASPAPDATDTPQLSSTAPRSDGIREP